MKIWLRDRIPGLAFLVPAMALFSVFIVYPIIFNVEASFLKWDGVNAGTFIGVDNFTRLFRDPIFLTALKNSFLWIPLTMIPQAGVGLALAVVLNKPLPGRTFYRIVFFVPVVLAPIVVGIAWQRILDPFNGVLANFSRYIGAGFLVQDWLGNPTTAIYTVMFVNSWMWTGFAMLFYLGGLQTIDPSVYEAALIDGATGWQAFWRITFPLLRSTHVSLFLLGIIGALKTFDLVWIMTKGGPNHASEMLPTYAFQSAFQLQEVGYASAISVILVVIAMAASLLMIRVFGSGFLTGDEK